MTKMKIFFLVFILFFLSCSSYKITTSQSIINNGQTGVSVQYLGTGGYVISYRGQTILTAPFFSNPSIDEVLFQNIATDTSIVDSYFPKNIKPDAMLVGHAHYDHLLDIPYISKKYIPGTKIYGSMTTKNILSVELDSSKIIVLNKFATSKKNMGKWIEINPQNKKGYFRFMAIKSGHAAHVGLPQFNFTLFEGKIKSPLKTLPENADGWKEGQTFSFLIDFINEDGTIDFRIFYQDAASQAPQGIPPAFFIDGNKRIDLAILCVPGYKQVINYPEAFVKALNPKIIILGHWEDFFADYT